jgi:Leucine-rich repeat (LRR) protein
MTIIELHKKLKEAYTSQNLNRISVTLIGLYKSQQFGTLQKIVEMLSDTLNIVIDPEARYFSRLMMLYHPDRGDFHRNEIERLAGLKDMDGLLGYAHILQLGRIEEIAKNLASYEDIDYSPVYDWDINLDGFTIVNEKESSSNEKKYTSSPGRGYTFYDAVKIRNYGNTGIHFPTHYLADMDEFELAESNIKDLDGVQYCIHATSMDLSGNSIRDISLLWGLTLLEELNLSDNQLEEVDALSNLKHLKSLNLSNNKIKDITPLLILESLEYVDLTGTRVSHSQIRELEETGITVLLNG